MKMCDDVKKEYGFIKGNLYLGKISGDICIIGDKNLIYLKQGNEFALEHAKREDYIDVTDQYCLTKGK